MNRLLYIGGLLALYGGVLRAQSSVASAHFLLHQPGDSLELVNIGQNQDAPYLITFAVKDSTTRLRIESDGAVWMEQQKEAVWQLTALQTGGRLYRFASPLIIAPTEIRINKANTAKTTYAISGKTGVLQLETVATGFESVETPLRNFTDCLKLEIKITWLENNRPVQRVEQMEWYAKGIGLVKMIKNTYQGDKRVTVDASLAKATVGGKPIAGRKR